MNSSHVYLVHVFPVILVRLPVVVVDVFVPWPGLEAINISSIHRGSVGDR